VCSSIGREVSSVRAIFVAFLDGVFVAAAWAGFALVGLAAIMRLLDWGHLLGPPGADEASRRAAWLTALVGGTLLVAGLIGVLLNVRG
jgi:hypothetical protein